LISSANIFVANAIFLILMCYMLQLLRVLFLICFMFVMMFIVLKF